MVVATTTMVELIIGMVILRKISHSLAPSTRAASVISLGIPFRPADRMTIAKPVHIQMPTQMSAGVLVNLFTSQGIGCPPSPTTMASRVPVCGWPAGWKSYISFQMMPAATNEIAKGIKISPLTATSYLTRSNKTAINKPKVTTNPVIRTSHRALFFNEVSITELVKT